MQDSRRYRILIHLAAAVVSLIILAPFAWLVIASLSSQADLLKIPLSWIPSHLSFNRYSQIFTAHGGTIFANFRASLLNSLIIATSTVAISITRWGVRRLRVRAAALPRRARVAAAVPLDVHGAADRSGDSAVPDHGSAAPAEYAPRA